MFSLSKLEVKPMVVEVTYPEGTEVPEVLHILFQSLKAFHEKSRASLKIILVPQKHYSLVLGDLCKWACYHQFKRARGLRTWVQQHCPEYHPNSDHEKK